MKFLATLPESLRAGAVSEVMRFSRNIVRAWISSIFHLIENISLILDMVLRRAGRPNDA